MSFRDRRTFERPHLISSEAGYPHVPTSFKKMTFYMNI
ncbi:GSCOCG00000032001-RA-CDS [Cotesia congregata]|nr:GSCOCG00000032001-RA-CDS [Cotesia congregata]